tara:strand:+ start:166 stop:585 length:420 start_codon:yes stop_codon:yes gene_type:complete
MIESLRQTRKHYQSIHMKTQALAALALTALATPAFAGPYVSTKSEFKGDEEGYSKTVHQARVGYATKLDNGIKPYAEVGTGISAADGVEILDGDNFTVAEVGASIPITESFSAKAKFEHKWGEDSARDWKFEVGTKYKF